ncbi:hypothetical protein [Ruegeria arenilitoris]|uniref:hypothetical protein n=1 Tax=Ruegeria arenilitoris TaxID=1173585 RepID=UPI00147A0199|nr:hypothetical protein [Ruegeria arenilitoris]
MAKKRKIIFAYRAHQSQMGSTVMRVHQLSEMLRTWQGDEFEVETVGIPRKRFHRRHRAFAEYAKDAIVVGLKFAISDMDPESVSLLRENARALCLDHVDSVPTEDTLPLYDVHIMASHEGRKKMERRLKASGAPYSAVMHVTHHADPRLPSSNPRSDDRFSICYLGNPKNMVEASEIVEVLPYMEKGFFFCAKLLAHYPAHYGVRTRSHSREVSKPFTKGFTAAAMNANIIVDRSTDDAHFYLGSDYPFLLPDNHPNTVLAGLEHMRLSYGGAEWKHGLDIMKSVRHLSSPRHIISELVMALDVAEAISALR